MEGGQQEVQGYLKEVRALDTFMRLSTSPCWRMQIETLQAVVASLEDELEGRNRTIDDLSERVNKVYCTD